VSDLPTATTPATQVEDALDAFASQAAWTIPRM